MLLISSFSWNWNLSIASIPSSLSTSFGPSPFGIPLMTCNKVNAPPKEQTRLKLKWKLDIQQSCKLFDITADVALHISYHTSLFRYIRTMHLSYHIFTFFHFFCLRAGFMDEWQKRFQAFNMQLYLQNEKWYTKNFFFSCFFWKKSHCWIFQQKAVPRKLVHEAINYLKDKEATILQEAKKRETNFPRKRKGVHPQEGRQF